MCHFGVKYSNSVLNCLIFIIIPLDSSIQIKVLINDLTLLLDLFGNSKGTKLLIWTVISCLVFTAPEKWRMELRAKTGHYRNRCFYIIFVYLLSDIRLSPSVIQLRLITTRPSWQYKTERSFEQGPKIQGTCLIFMAPKLWHYHGCMWRVCQTVGKERRRRSWHSFWVDQVDRRRSKTQNSTT